MGQSEKKGTGVIGARSGKHLAAWGLALAMAVGIWASCSALASGEGVTREQYKEAVEPICKSNSEANENILKGVRKKVREEKLDAAGAQFIRASTALNKTLKKLKVVAGPPADEQRLEQWLEGVEDESKLLREVGKALQADNRGRADRLSAQLYAGARSTNALVIPFEFRYCVFEPSKYA